MSIKQSDKPMPFFKISYENIQDYLRWIVPGFITLFLLFDILPESFKKAEILLPSGIILSIFIYSITHLISHTQCKDLLCNGIRNFCLWIFKFFTVGRSYEHHIKQIVDKAKEKGIIEDKNYNNRQLLELYKQCQDENLLEHHEVTHRYTSYYWLFSCSALAVLLSILFRIFIGFYNLISNYSSLKSIILSCPFSLEKIEHYQPDIFVIAISIAIIIVFRVFAKEFAKRTTEADEIVIDIISSKFKK